MGSFRTWVRADWLKDHPDDADTLIAARAVECGVPEGIKPSTLYSRLRGAYLYIWNWPEEYDLTATEGKAEEAIRRG